MALRFGPRVAGHEKYEVELARHQQRRSRFGDRVVGSPSEPASAAQPADGATAEPQPTGISIAEMQKQLADNPLLVDQLLAAEQQRAEGPRKGALRLLLKAEVGPGGEARPEVVAALEQLIG